MLTKNQIKFIQSLSNKKNRKQEGVFLAEGVKILSELLKSEFKVIRIYTSERYYNQLQPSASAKNIPIDIVSPEDIQKISTLENNQSAIALVETKTFEGKLPQLGHKTLVLDGINDPGNLGTLLRTAEWFGVENVWCSSETVDLFNPKVISGSMGSVFRINVSYGPLIEWLSRPKIPTVFGTFLEGENCLDITPPTSPSLLVMGSESHGISPQIHSLISRKITIPNQGKGESLNVGVSAGIIMHTLWGKG